MRNILHIISIALFINVLTISCKHKLSDSYQIQLNSAEQKQLNLSEYVVSLEYVPLETTEECLIDKYPRFHVLEDYIVASTWRQCYLFDRKGKFIREIGRQGNDPKDYARTLSGEVFDENNLTVMMIGSTGQGLIYSFDGKVSGHFPIAPNMQEIAYLSDNLWVQGINNSNGDAVNQLVFTDQSKLIDSIPNDQFFQRV
ncbi:MAG: DUF4934 domain-containing protein [Bacteroidales bacterium]|jgi:hypothetical protein|nr:DUF4934 domain-containing protein [Bacteroidales bacterium]